jgi:hypothetical protein
MLLLQDIIGVTLTWTLVFREIAQYAVRLAENEWYSTQSRLDRFTTQGFTIVIQLTLFLELIRELTVPSARSSEYILVANALLWAAAAASFSRIVPRLMSAWRRALAE